jgi:hypothetical protein
MNNKDKFHAAYLSALTEEHAKDPLSYAFDASELPIVAARMVEAYGRKTGNPGPAVKKAAKALGLLPTLTSVHSYLLADAQQRLLESNPLNVSAAKEYARLMQHATGQGGYDWLAVNSLVYCSPCADTYLAALPFGEQVSLQPVRVDGMPAICCVCGKSRESKRRDDDAAVARKGIA